MLGGQPEHGWQLCFPISLQAGGSDFRLHDSSDLSIDEISRGLMLWLLSGPPGFTCWISFAPVFSFIYC